ncbi:hypothetical protein [Paraeggerthella sp.]|uniref:hypothetical protein n=1 Tax=Paraeggerthella sp. TaxID=2897350 RepID=UPI00352822F3
MQKAASFGYVPSGMDSSVSPVFPLGAGRRLNSPWVVSVRREVEQVLPEVDHLGVDV